LIIKLEPQLTLISLDALKSQVSTQNERLAKITGIIADANKRIANGATEIAASAPKGTAYTQDEKRFVQQMAHRQVVTLRNVIRRETDALITPVLRQMQDAAKEAKQRAERHFDKYSILRRSFGTLSGGIVAATQMRAAYAEIFEQSGPVELARWAQAAIDTGDTVLADSVIRANNNKPTADRTFSSQELLNAIPNAEYDTAQASCQAVIDLEERAGVAWSEFQNDKPNALGRIAMGLRKMPEINADGSIDAPDVGEFA